MILPLEGHRHIHFVGIGGIGMSALARWLLAQDYEVSGSDRDPGEQGEALTRLGARVSAGHRGDAIGDADLVVVSSAVGPDNPEVRAAEDRGTLVVKRAELLSWIFNAGRGIAVAGTHGKTTTSALVGHLLVAAGRDPTILIGGISANLGSNARVGGPLVVAEADEYDGSFLRLRPEIAILTNVEADHLDFYGTAEQVYDAFRQFAHGITDRLVYCADDPIAAGIAREVSATAIGYGLDSGEWQASGLGAKDGFTHFTVEHDGIHTPYTSALFGRHNVLNSLAAIVVAASLDVPVDVIQTALPAFSGVARRLEFKGDAAGVLVLDDYAVHPTEVRAALTAVKQRYQRPVRAVFQPHTYSRTKAFLADFACAFRDADVVYLLDIYAAREHDSLGISGQDLSSAVRRCHSNVHYTRSIEDTLAVLLDECNVGDVVVTLGAGDVFRLGPRLLAEL